MVVLGRIVTGRFEAVDPNALAAGVGGLYEVDVALARAMTFEQENAAAEAVWAQLQAPEVSLLGIEAHGNTVKVQVFTVPALAAAEAGHVTAMFWMILIPALAGILAGLGLLVQWLTLNRFVSAIPSWVWTVLILSGGAALVLYAVSLVMRPRTVSVPSWVSSRI